MRYALRPLLAIGACAALVAAVALPAAAQTPLPAGLELCTAPPPGVAVDGFSSLDWVDTRTGKVLVINARVSGNPAMLSATLVDDTGKTPDGLGSLYGHINFVSYGMIYVASLPLPKSLPANKYAVEIAAYDAMGRVTRYRLQPGFNEYARVSAMPLGDAAPQACRTALPVIAFETS